MDYKDCKYNTSGIATFDGYCDLPKYHHKWGKELIMCKKCPCDDFEPEEVES